VVGSPPATMRPLSASPPMCSLRHDRRRLVRCFSTNHSPAPHSFNPMLSTRRCTGPALDGGRATASVSARRLSVEWAGIARSRPSRWMTEPISPSVWRKACPQGQRGCDRYGRIERLTAPCRPWLGPPGRDRLFAEPDRQAATLPQGSIIFRPVGYPILLLGDVMTAIGIGFEWHSGHPRGLWMGVAPSHLGLLSPLCRSRRLWRGATLTSERQVALSQRRTSST